MITVEGLAAIRRYFAGVESSLADTLSIGLDGAPGGKMVCEWYRIPVSLRGTNFDQSQVVFKASANVNVIGQVREVGLIQGGLGLAKDITISRFSNTEEAWTGNYTFTSVNSRLETGLKVNANQTASATINSVDVLATRDVDLLTIAGYAESSGNVDVTLTLDNNSTVTFTFNVTQGYGVTKVAKGAGVKSGSVNWQNVVGITINPKVNYTIDLLKFEILQPLNETLIARTVLPQPITVETTMPLEIEYPLGVRLVP